MTGTAISLISTFLFLSSVNDKEYKVFHHADRAQLEAAYMEGEKPLVFSDNDVFTLTNQADVISAVVLTDFPQPNLRHTWSSLGVKVLYGVGYNPEGTAENFRRQCAFLPISKAMDGVYIKDPKNLPKAWKHAVLEAKRDAEVYTYLMTLCEKALAHKNPLLHTEARRVSFFIGQMGAEWEDLDCLRLECVAFAKRLEMLLGLPEKDLPIDFTLPVADDTPPVIPFSKSSVRPVEVNVAAYTNKDVPLDGKDDGKSCFTFSSTASDFTISLISRTGPERKNWLVNAPKFKVSLYIPSNTGKGYEPYHFELDANDFNVGPRAPVPALWSYLYSLDERFTPYGRGYGIPQPRVKVKPSCRTPSLSHPSIMPGFNLRPIKGGGYSLNLTFSWVDLYGSWPAVVSRKSDNWYIAAERLPDGARPAPAKLIWSRGREANFKTLSQKLNLGALTERYKTELKRTEKVWKTAFEERLYKFEKTPKPTFNRYEVSSDTNFYERVAKPLIDANLNIWNMVQNDKEHPKPKVRTASDAVQNTIYKSLGKLLYLSQNMGKARRDYLRDRFAGKPLPALVKKEEPKKDTKAPTNMLEDDSFNDLQLDDVQF